MEKFNFKSIKSFEDACKHLNLDPNAFYFKFENMPDHITALVSLEVITRALNNGWRHPLDGKTTVFYPWFFLVTEREQEESWFKDIPDSRKVGYLRPDGSAGLGSATSVPLGRIRTRPSALALHANRKKLQCTVQRLSKTTGSRTCSHSHGKSRRSMAFYGNNLIFRSAVSCAALWKLKERSICRQAQSKLLIIYDNGRQFKVKIK